jgi:hypothetical protein
MPYVEVWVDDQDALEDASDEKLLAELRKRNLPGVLMDTEEQLDKIFYAFYFGKTDKVIEMVRTYVQDVTGRTLP